MITQQDSEIIDSICGGKVPRGVEREYRVRQKMFHLGGGSGSLGIMSCVDILRYCGVDIPSSDKMSEQSTIDWGKVPEGSPVQVDMGEDLADAEFVGPGFQGRVNVRFGEDRIIHEFPSSACRLKVDVEWLELSDEEMRDLFIASDQPDWDSLAEGAQVVVADNEDGRELYTPAKFIDEKDGKVTVQIGGETRTYQQDYVAPCET